MVTTARNNPLSYLTNQLNDLKSKGTHFRLRVLDDEQAPVCTFDGKKVINLASNNYLGLTTHPKLREAALEATRKYGVGSGAVRTIAGTMKIHMELEEKIARFKNVEACVVFQSGFAANAGTVSPSSARTTSSSPISSITPPSSTALACRARKSWSSSTRTSRKRKKSWPASPINPAESCSSRTGSSPWMATSAPYPRSAIWPRNTAPS